MSNDATQDSGAAVSSTGEFTRGQMDISAQSATWHQFGAMVKWGSVATAIIGIVATYAVYISHY